MGTLGFQGKDGGGRGDRKKGDNSARPQAGTMRCPQELPPRVVLFVRVIDVMSE